MFPQLTPHARDSYAAAMTMLLNPEWYDFSTLRALYELRTNWIACRSLWKAFTHEEYLYRARLGAYAGAKNPLALLRQRIGSLVSQEYTNWSSLAANRRATKSPVPGVN